MKRTYLYILPLLSFLAFSLVFNAEIALADTNKKSRCGGAALVGIKNQTKPRSKLTWIEQQRLTKLKTTLVGDGIAPETIDALFNHDGFGVYDVTKILFKKNPEKVADSGDATYLWYRECFGADARIAKGKKFLKKQNSVLSGAEKKYGVDKRYIVSILGVESSFAKDPGKFKAVNALASQYILVKRRKNFAYRQLKELIRYSERTGMALPDITSSYAGAIGCGQFIPSSLNAYFVGKDGKVEKADPFNTTDCIYSIAYYLKKSRWDKRENGTTPTRGSKNWKAIRAYNHSDAYTRFVIDVAESL